MKTAIVLCVALCGCTTYRPDPLYETPERRAANAVAIQEAIVQAKQAIAVQQATLSASKPQIQSP